ncbi:M81 family metallopeptidase [Pelagibius litoralis]|uniref:Microcystinase C n=1 Tax=Pelagibius litoralis TaxID=374515 RepID=A0A967F0S4_9PROT|nr:M81 family metallopeptidase [Pelagibius litoralis]NIA70970.1 M81 family metallopeptidase [Pelagibius litoralis]
MSSSRNHYKVAVGSLMAECNPRSPTATKEEFYANGFFAGESLMDDIRQSHPRAPQELKAFTDQFRKLEPTCQLIPLISAYGGATGPIEQSFLDEMIAEICDCIRSALPVDAVYLALHGSAKGAEDEDPEATLLNQVRHIVGPKVPIVVTLDLHANVSSEMAQLANVLIAYRTNPHVDMAECGTEAAELVARMLKGMQTRSAFVKLPLIAPSPTQLTDKYPIRDVLDYAQSLWKPPVLHISLTTGYTHGDSPKSGMAVTVTTEDDEETAKRVATAVASKLWQERDGFVLNLITIDDAVSLARKANLSRNEPAVIFADTSDNPGGGARGNTIWLLSAFHEAGIQDCVMGGLNDPMLAAEAHRLGEGATFRAKFNRNEEDPLSGKFDAEAVIERLHNGRCVGRKGVMEGQSLDLGASCLLRIGGIRVLVISIRQQCYDPVFFEMVGVDLAQVRSVAVKSRGHFRAGFSEFFGPEQVYDVDSPGLTARQLDAFPFHKIPRPMYPLDPQATWSGVVSLEHAAEELTVSKP